MLSNLAATDNIIWILYKYYENNIVTYIISKQCSYSTIFKDKFYW